MDGSDDFITPIKSSSKLASLFGLSKPSSSENTSLLFTAPKQPKSDSSPKKITDPPSSNLQLQVILPKTVHAYKLVEGSYQALGKVGLTLVGCKIPPHYQLLLYRTREDVICKIRILQNFAFSILDNNYASFYSEANQNFSVMFESDSDIKAFAKQVAIVRSSSELLTSLLSQDIFAGQISQADNEKCFEISYTFSEVFDGAVLSTSAPRKETANLTNSSHFWLQCLEGMKPESSRVIIVPSNMNNSTLPTAHEKSNILIEVNRLPDVLPALPNDNDAIVCSSAEESNVKEKGVLISESIMNKSQKSNLISRMARMGQATLPLRGAIPAEPSDSEDDSSPSPKARPRLKPRPENISANSELPSQPQGLQHVNAPPQTLTLYQPNYHPQALVPRADFTHFAPVITPSATTPSEATLSTYFSETRTQTTELRMGISKLSDKMDTLLAKVQDIQGGRAIQSSMTMDPTSLLSNVQAIVDENQSLKVKVEEQRGKIEILNERVYNLLDLNHKSIEKQTTLSNQSSEAEFKFLLAKSSEEISVITASLRAQEEQNNHLMIEKTAMQEKITDAEELKSLLDITVDELRTNFLSMERDLKQVMLEKAELESKNSKQSQVKEQYNAILSENASIQKQLTESAELNLSHEKTIAELRFQLSTAQNDLTQTIGLRDENTVLEVENKKKCSDLETANNSLNSQIETLNKLVLELQKTAANNGSVVSSLEGKVEDGSTISNQPSDTTNTDNLKELMNILFRKLHSQFQLNETYTGETIKKIIAAIIRDMTLEFIRSKDQELKTLKPSIEDTPTPTIMAEVPSYPSVEDNKISGVVENLEESNNDSEIRSNVASPVEERSDPASDSESTVSPAQTPNEQAGASDASEFVPEASVTSPTIDEEETPRRKSEGETKHSTYDQTWRPTQPPPPPLFDDEDSEDGLW